MKFVSFLLVLSFHFIHVPCMPEHGNYRTPLEHWAKAACQAQTMKENEHYVCNKSGQIICLTGWSNEQTLCRDPVCDPPCNGTHGFCSSPNTCTCNVGWEGAKCDQCVRLPGCQNGICDKPYECKCESGWHGTFCDKPVCREGCGNGYCSIPGECVCHPGWTGPNCTECKKLPGCSEFGFCTKPMECHCLPGYEGNFCHKPICKRGCNATNGFCEAPNQCWCKIGWQGESCDECMPYPGCKGTCNLPWECNCPLGFTGKLCKTPIILNKKPAANWVPSSSSSANSFVEIVPSQNLPLKQSDEPIPASSTVVFPENTENKSPKTTVPIKKADEESIKKLATEIRIKESLENSQ